MQTLMERAGENVHDTEICEKSRFQDGMCTMLHFAL